MSKRLKQLQNRKAALVLESKKLTAELDSADEV